MCERQLKHHHRPESVKQDLEGAEKRLTQDRVEKESLNLGRQICVNTIDTE